MRLTLTIPKNAASNNTYKPFIMIILFHSYRRWPAGIAKTFPGSRSAKMAFISTGSVQVSPTGIMKKGRRERQPLQSITQNHEHAITDRMFCTKQYQNSAGWVELSREKNSLVTVF